MNGRILGQLAVVALRDMDALADSYAWPPRAPMTADEVREVERLRVLAGRLHYQAASRGWGSAGTDELFGGGA